MQPSEKSPESSGPVARSSLITHAWAIEKVSPVPEWIERMSSLLAEREFSAISSRIQKFRSGRGLIFRATALGGEVAGHDP